MFRGIWQKCLNWSRALRVLLKNVSLKGEFIISIEIINLKKWISYKINFLIQWIHVHHFRAGEWSIENNLRKIDCENGKMVWTVLFYYFESDTSGSNISEFRHEFLCLLNNRCWGRSFSTSGLCMVSVEIRFIWKASHEIN